MFTGQIKWLTKYKYRRTAVVAEWLRRLTRNQFPSGSAGSNPADCELFGKKFASSGNRTRAARVAGEHSTTEPTMHCI